MDLASSFPLIKSTHLALVTTSGGLFALRGAALLAGRSWPSAPAVRAGSVVIDTLLLAAGVAMWAQLRLSPLTDGWLGAKLLLLLAYIVLGTLALKRARTRRGRAVAYLLALAVFGHMVAVPRLHHPLGLLAPA